MELERNDRPEFSSALSRKHVDRDKRARLQHAMSLLRSLWFNRDGSVNNPPLQKVLGTLLEPYVDIVVQDVPVHSWTYSIC